jgi:hypothetical protein
MGLSLKHLSLIICIPLAGVLGYWLGYTSYIEEHQQDATVSSYMSSAEFPDEKTEGFVAQTNASNSRTTKSKSAEVEAVIQQQQPETLPIDPLEAAQQKAKEFNYPLPAPDKDHNDERQNFVREYSEEDEDWQAKTHFTDFLLLHDDAHLIDLHKIICNSEKCQLIGRYNAEHESWDEIVKQMQQQDWWTYWGTSSSTTTRDGVTYFNLFVNKPE